MRGRPVDARRPLEAKAERQAELQHRRVGPSVNSRECVGTTTGVGGDVVCGRMGTLFGTTTSGLSSDFDDKIKRHHHYIRKNIPIERHDGAKAIASLTTRVEQHTSAIDKDMNHIKEHMLETRRRSGRPWMICECRARRRGLPVQVLDRQGGGRIMTDLLPPDLAEEWAQPYTSAKRESKVASGGHKVIQWGSVQQKLKRLLGRNSVPELKKITEDPSSL